VCCSVLQCVLQWVWNVLQSVLQWVQSVLQRVLLCCSGFGVCCSVCYVSVLESPAVGVCVAVCVAICVAVCVAV